MMNLILVGALLYGSAEPQFGTSERLALQTSAHELALSAPVACGSNAIASSVVRISGTISIDCVSGGVEERRPLELRADRVIVDAGSKVESHHGRGLLVVAREIDWLGEAVFDFSGRPGSPGSPGADGHAWSVVDDHSNAWNEFIYSQLHDGGSGGGGGGGWPGADVVLVSQVARFIAGSKVEISSVGGRGGKGGRGGLPDTRAFYPSTDDQAHGTNAQAAQSAAHGHPGSAGKNGSAGAVVVTADIVAGTWHVSSRGENPLMSYPVSAPEGFSAAEALAPPSAKARETYPSPPPHQARVFSFARHAFRTIPQRDDQLIESYILWVAARIWGRPILITSGSRGPRRFKDGRRDRSYHIHGGAVDLAASGDLNHRLVEAQALSRALGPKFRVQLEDLVSSGDQRLLVETSLFQDGYLVSDTIVRWSEGLATGTHIHVNPVVSGAVPKDFPTTAQGLRNSLQLRSSVPAPVLPPIPAPPTSPTSQPSVQNMRPTSLPVTGPPVLPSMHGGVDSGGNPTPTGGQGGGPVVQGGIIYLNFPP